jgi:hypothetical protein
MEFLIRDTVGILRMRRHKSLDGGASTLLGIATRSQETLVICTMSRRMAGSSLVRVSSRSGGSLVADSLSSLKETTTSLRCTTMAREMSPAHLAVGTGTMFASKAKVPQILL